MNTKIPSAAGYESPCCAQIELEPADSMLGSVTISNPIIIDEEEW